MDILKDGASNLLRQGAGVADNLVENSKLPSWGKDALKEISKAVVSQLPARKINTPSGSMIDKP